MNSAAAQPSCPACGRATRARLWLCGPCGQSMVTGAPDPGAFAAALPVRDLIGVDTLSMAPGVLARCLLCGHHCAAATTAQATRAAASHLITGHGAMIGIR